MKFENSNWIFLVTNDTNVSTSQNKLFLQVKKGLDHWNAVFVTRRFRVQYPGAPKSPPNSGDKK